LAASKSALWRPCAAAGWARLTAPRPAPSTRPRVGRRRHGSRPNRPRSGRARPAPAVPGRADRRRRAALARKTRDDRHRRRSGARCAATGQDRVHPANLTDPVGAVAMPSVLNYLSHLSGPRGSFLSGSHPVARGRRMLSPRAITAPAAAARLVFVSSYGSLSQGLAAEEPSFCRTNTL
jgi:hypothetical protein